MCGGKDGLQRARGRHAAKVTWHKGQEYIVFPTYDIGKIVEAKATDTASRAKEVGEAAYTVLDDLIHELEFTLAGPQLTETKALEDTEETNVVSEALQTHLFDSVAKFRKSVTQAEGSIEGRN